MWHPAHTNLRPDTSCTSVGPLTYGVPTSRVVAVRDCNVAHCAGSITPVACSCCTNVASEALLKPSRTLPALLTAPQAAPCTSESLHQQQLLVLSVPQVTQQHPRLRILKPPTPQACKAEVCQLHLPPATRGCRNALHCTPPMPHPAAAPLLRSASHLSPRAPAVQYAAAVLPTPGSSAQG